MRWADWSPDADGDRRTGQRWGILEVEHKNLRHTGVKRKVVVPPASN